MNYRLTADSDNFDKGFKSAEASANAMERALAKLEAQQRKVHGSMTEVGIGTAAAGAAIAAGLGLAVKAAIDWETAWTGVAKVVDGSPEEMAALEAEIRNLAKTLPQAHDEIANVAAAAGQLGVKRQDIAEFTKVMVMMGTATNLSSEEAAFSLARMMNVMQTAPENVGRLGSAIVNLGNNFATTEAEVVAMALRISGAGHTIGMTEADVLGFSAALSSVGIEAEAGGTAISTAFIKIETAVRGGGEELDKFAAVAGMSSEKFSQAYERDAARAIATFIAGLGRIKTQGGDVFAVLENLGFSEIRMRDAMLRLSGAGDTLSRSLDVANRGWDENRALLDEAERRYGTVEARMQIAQNSINDFAIDLGQNFLPMVGKGADMVKNLADFFGDLPGPIQTALVVMSLLVSAFLLVGGAALLAVPKIAAYKAAIDTLAESEGRLAGATVATTGMLGRVGSFLTGPWGAAIGFAISMLGLFAVETAKSDDKMEQFMGTLEVETGKVTQNSRVWMANELQRTGAVDRAKQFGLDLTTLVGYLTGEEDAIKRVNEALKVNAGDSEAVTNSKKILAGVLTAESGIVADAADKWKELNGAGQAVEPTMRDLDAAARQLAEGLGITAGHAKDLNKELDELDKELKAILDSIFGLQNAEDDLQDAVDTLTEGIQKQRKANDEGAGSFEGMSKAARENRDNLQGVLEKMAALTLETVAHTGSATEATNATNAFKAQMAILAEQLGINIGDVAGYNDAVAAIEREVNTRFAAEIAAAVAQLNTYQHWLDSIPREVVTRMRAEEESARGGPREFEGGRAGGGIIWGPSGVDQVFNTPLTRGEYINTVSSTQRNHAALEAANAGATLAVVGSGGGGGGGGGYGGSTYNIYPRTAEFGPRQLQLVQAQQEALERAGRPR